MKALWIGLAAMSLAMPVMAQDIVPGPYRPGPDSQVQAVAKGTLHGPYVFHSKVFEGTSRLYWVYVPVGYDANTPPNLLVWQDGHRTIRPDGSEKLPIVLDNLIASGDIPPTIGVFVTPGNMSDTFPDVGWNNPDHRAPEYDDMDDDYARLIIDEILPEVRTSWAFTDDPKRRVIGGASSGAVAAFTVGWHRPDAFGNVVSFIGSYVSIGYKPATGTTPAVFGADTYPGLIRKSPIRPLRIFLQDGSNDLDNEHGNWFLANQQMVRSIEWANAHAEEWQLGPHRYELNYVWGDGGHTGEHGGAILPDVLRWIWPKPVQDPK